MIQPLIAGLTSPILIEASSSVSIKEPPLLAIPLLESHCTNEQAFEAYKYILKNLGPGLDPIIYQGSTPYPADLNTQFQDILDKFYVSKTSINRNYNPMTRSLVVKYQFKDQNGLHKTNIPIWIMKSICTNITICEGVKLSDIFQTVEFKALINQFTNDIGAHPMRMILNVDLNKIKPTDLGLQQDTTNLVIFEIKRMIPRTEIEEWINRRKFVKK